MNSRSALARHPKYSQIIQVYQGQFVAGAGRVNETKFYNEHIKPIVPGFGYKSWAAFILRFRKKSGMVASLAVKAASAAPAVTAENNLEIAIMTNDAATQIGINAALTIGARALEELLKDPVALAAMSPAARSELMFKAMKAQDSRIHAIGKLKEDNREEQKFNKTFGGAAM